MCSNAPTTLDILHAMAYAKSQVDRMKCEDPEIISKVCKESGKDCLTWREDKGQQFFPTPENYYKKQCGTSEDCEFGTCEGGQCVCKNDNDCNPGLKCLNDPDDVSKLVCGYAPKDISAGHCVFNNKTDCIAQDNFHIHVIVVRMEMRRGNVNTVLMMI